MERFDVVRMGGQVKRWHTVPMIRQQTVGEHTFGVMTFAMEAWGELSQDLIYAIMYHDVAEYITGDIPATSKWAFPQMQAAAESAERYVENQYFLPNASGLNASDLRKLKIADMMDLIMWCVEESILGNRTALEWANNGMTSLKDRFGETEEFEDAFRVYELWKDKRVVAPPVP